MANSIFRRRCAPASPCSRASSAQRIEEVRRERITFAPGGRTLVQTMKTHGAFTSLVSGGFTFFADYIGKRIGFDEAMANILEFDGDNAQRHGRRSDPGQGSQAQPPDDAGRFTRHSAGGDHGGRRRRQRPRHDQGGRPRRRAPRQAGRGRAGRSSASTTAISPPCSICRATRTKISSASLAG